MTKFLKSTWGIIIIACVALFIGFGLGSPIQSTRTVTKNHTVTKTVTATPDSCATALNTSDALFAGPVSESLDAFTLMTAAARDLANGDPASALPKIKQSNDIMDQANTELDTLGPTYKSERDKCLADAGTSS